MYEQIDIRVKIWTHGFPATQTLGSIPIIAYNFAAMPWLFSTLQHFYLIRKLKLRQRNLDFIYCFASDPVNPILFFFQCISMTTRLAAVRISLISIHTLGKCSEYMLLLKSVGKPMKFQGGRDDFRTAPALKYSI